MAVSPEEAEALRRHAEWYDEDALFECLAPMWCGEDPYPELRRDLDVLTAERLLELVEKPAPNAVDRAEILIMVTTNLRMARDRRHHKT